MTDNNRTYTENISRERQKETGEHFTPESITLDMIKRVEEWYEDQTFLDPCAGDGNILEIILKKKLEMGFDPTKSLKSIYGIELMPDNAKACRQRLLDIAGDTEEHREIMNNNIVCANALTYDYSFDENIMDVFF